MRAPYGAIVWNEKEQLPQNWFFDAHLLDAGAAAPRCVGVCPTEVFKAVKTSDEAMGEIASARACVSWSLSSERGPASGTEI